MKKGTNPFQIIMIIQDLLDNNSDLDITEPQFKVMVENRYNEIYGVTSKETMAANLREDAIIEHQEDYKLVKLPQDGNKVDIMGAKIENGVVSLIVSQQKGNNASFNSTSFQKTLEKLKEFYDNKKVEQYFDLLPDELNPTLNGLPYSLEVIIGMAIACGQSQTLDSERNIKLFSNGEYLEKMGIHSYDMVDITLWVTNHDKIKNHKYDAVSKCCDFDEIYNKCIEKLNV